TSRVINEQLRAGPQKVLPGRGGPAYKDFFDLSPRLDPASGDCRLQLIPKVRSLVRDDTPNVIAAITKADACLSSSGSTSVTLACQTSHDNCENLFPKPDENSMRLFSVVIGQ